MWGPWRLRRPVRRKGTIVGAAGDRDKRERTEAKLAGRFADELARIHAKQAALAARETQVLADAYALTEAQKARIISTSSRERDMPLRSMALELALAARVNDRAMQTSMHDAFELATAYPETLASLREGRISRRHAQTIQDAGRVLDDPIARAEFERVVLAYAETTTAARTRRFAKSRADAMDPRSLQERHHEAVSERRIWVTDLDDAMSTLTILGPSLEVHGVYDRLTRQGRVVQDIDAESRRAQAAGGGAAGGATAGGAVAGGEGFGIAGRDGSFWGGGDDAARNEDDVWFDDRTLDQIRVDLALDMLLTGSTTIDPAAEKLAGGLGAITAQVQITLPMTTLTGLTSNGAELNGATPIDPVTARRLAGGAPVWERLMTHPITGVVVAVDRYHPHPAQRRFLEARDMTCRTPGCRRRASRCDLDHSHDHAFGGPTDVDNLCCQCKRHHTLKHAAAWQVRQHPGGVLEFTSPGGHTYVDRPTPRVVFVPSDDGGVAVAPF